jgi:cytochrome c553
MQSRAFLFLAACFVSPLLFSFAEAQQGSTTDVGQIYPQDADIEAGRAIVVGAYNFGQTPQPQRGNCFQCHGMNGKGDQAAAFPRLTDQSYKYLYESLKNYASGVRNNPIMSPIAKALADQQMRDVAAYYAVQTDAPYGPRPEVDPDVLQYGASLAAVGSATRGVQGCINCHGPDGAGLAPTYPYLGGQYANYLQSQLRAWKTGARRGGAAGGIMEYIAKRMTDEDIRAVSLYYARMRPPSVTPEQAQARQMPASPGAGQPAR